MKPESNNPESKIYQITLDNQNIVEWYEYYTVSYDKYGTVINSAVFVFFTFGELFIVPRAGLLLFSKFLYSSFFENVIFYEILTIFIHVEFDETNYNRNLFILAIK